MLGISFVALNSRSWDPGSKAAWTTATRKGTAAMPIESRLNLRLPGVAGILAFGMAILATPVEAGGGAGDLPHACFANDSIVMGKRLAPRPAVIEARLNSPACRERSAVAAPSADDAAAILREMDRIDQKLRSLYRDEATPATPSSANWISATSY